MSEPVSIVNVEDVEWKTDSEGEHYASCFRALSKGMALGVNIERIAPGKISCPYHYHFKEDEFFFILKGRATLRLPDETREVKQGDAISCPHGEDSAHQFYNHTDEDVEILMVSQNKGDEVAFYPDSGKYLIRDLKKVGYFKEADYMDGEPELPVIKR